MYFNAVLECESHFQSDKFSVKAQHFHHLITFTKQSENKIKDL